MKSIQSWLFQIYPQNLTASIYFKKTRFCLLAQIAQLLQIIFIAIVFKQFTSTKLQNINREKQQKVGNNLMHMLKPTFRTQSSFKDKKTNSSSYGIEPLSHQNKPIFNTSLKPHPPRYSHGIGLSIKNFQNRQIPIPVFQPVNSQQNFDGYLQKMVKANLEKMSQIRKQHEKEKDQLFKEISTLKSENNILKSRLEQLSSQGEFSLQFKRKQLSNSLEKRLKLTSQKTLSPNPQKASQRRVQIEQMRQKTVKLSKELEQFKKRNAILSVEKRNLNSTVEKLQKQSLHNLSEIQKLKKIQQSVTRELKEAKIMMESLKKQNQTEKQKLLIEIEKVNAEKEIKKEKEKLSNHNSHNHQITFKIINDPRTIGFVDKRVVKHFQNQLKEKENLIHQKDYLINDLNEKILSTGLSGLNTKYKYLMKV